MSVAHPKIAPECLATSSNDFSVESSKEEIHKACINFVTELESSSENQMWYTGLFFIRLLLSVSFTSALYYLSYYYFEGSSIKYFFTFLLGISLVHIGMTTFHDLGHRTEMKNHPFLVDFIYNFCCALFGYSGSRWRWKHNHFHHVYTNIISEHHPSDPDISGGFLNFTKEPSQNKLLKYQHIYSWLLYPFLFVVMQWNGFVHVIKKENLKGKAVFLVTSLFHYAVFFLVPSSVASFSDLILQYLLTFSTMSFVLAVLFQISHVVEETNIHKLSKEDSSDLSKTQWFFHQLDTTSNFSVNNVFLRYFTGGLTNQVEHHLFPSTSYFNHRKINLFLKKQLKEHGLGHLYKERPFFASIASHYRALALGSYQGE